MNRTANTSVSIVIPCYNHALYLTEAIESALAQDYPRLEIIVVDDGSTDSSANLALGYKDRVSLLQQPNRGPSAARNAGIRVASGEYIVCLDADDRLLPAFCRETVAVLNCDPEVGIVATGFRFFGRSSSIRIPRAVSLAEHLAANPITCSSLFRKSDWVLVGGFDEKIRYGYEDWEFWLGIRKSGKKLRVVPKVLFEYRRKQSSRVVDGNARVPENLAYLHNKHADLYSVHLNAIHTILFACVSCGQSMYVKVARTEWDGTFLVRLRYLAKALLPSKIARLLAKTVQQFITLQSPNEPTQREQGNGVIRFCTYLKERLTRSPAKS